MKIITPFLLLLLLVAPVHAGVSTSFLSFDDIPANASNNNSLQSSSSWVFTPYAYYGAPNYDMWINSTNADFFRRAPQGNSSNCGNNSDHMGQHHWGFWEVDDTVAISGNALKYTITGGYSSNNSICPDYGGLNINNKAEYLAGTGTQHANRIVGTPYIYAGTNINWNPNSPPQTPLASAAANSNNNRFTFYVKAPASYTVDSGGGRPNYVWQIGPWVNLPRVAGGAMGGHFYSEVGVGGPGWVKIQIDNHPNWSNTCSNSSVVCISRALSPSNSYSGNFIANMYGFYIATSDYSGKEMTPYSLWFDEIKFEYDDYAPQNEETINNIGVSFDPLTNKWQIGFSDKYTVGSITLFKSTYELRYSFSPITNENWDAATPAHIQAYPNFGIVADTTGKFKRVSNDAYARVWATFKLSSATDEVTLVNNRQIYFAVKDISQDPNNMHNVNPSLTGSFVGQGRDYTSNPTIFYDYDVDVLNLPYIKRADYKLPAATALDATPPTTTASPAAGAYTGTQTVTLAANEAATIYYTTDGSTPTTSSPVYTGPITISSTTTLKWFSRDTAGNSEAVQAAVYTIQQPAAAATHYGRINAIFRGIFH